jgi:hypothetical protein
MIPMDKLMAFDRNKYVFCRASMSAVDKILNIEEYPTEGESWKVVPNILKLMLNNQLQYLNEKDVAE